MTQLDVLPHTLRPLQPREAEVATLVAHAAAVVPHAAADVPGGHAGAAHVLGVGLLLLEHPRPRLRTPRRPWGAVLGWGTQRARVIVERRYCTRN